MDNNEYKYIMAIESSCDETAIAILKDGEDLVANVVASQIPIHKLYGGVVPEIASRQHMQIINKLIEEAVTEAKITLKDINAIAVSKGPGLVGALLVGVSTAKALAYSLGIPFLGINHMEGHIYANWLNHKDIEFPIVGLIASGGHSAVMMLKGHGDYTLLGQTVDDAAGEAYDKVARAIGLTYPGGPLIDKMATAWEEENQDKDYPYDLPRAKCEGKYDFSFSGLKTAVLNTINNDKARGIEIDVPGMCASFQNAVTSVLVDKAILACKEYNCNELLLAGGVSANSGLRKRAKIACEKNGIKLFAPENRFCTDNAAMVSVAGYYRIKAGQKDDLCLNANPSLGMEDM